MDLQLLPISRIGGQDQTSIPELYAPEMPRRPARGRHADRLILYLEIAGSISISGEHTQRLLINLAKVYYKTPGSVTSAMRKAAEALNDKLLQLNMKSPDGGVQGAGILTILTLRNETLFIAQSGPTHGYLISAKETRHVHDIGSAGRGLGVGQTTPIYYSQAQLNVKDTVLISYSPPSGWSTATLAGLYSKDPHTVHQHLLNQTNIDFSALLINASPGPGNIQLLKPQAKSRAPIAVPPAQVAGQPVSTSQTEQIGVEGTIPATHQPQTALTGATAIQEPAEIIEEVAEPIQAAAEEQESETRTETAASVSTEGEPIADKKVSKPKSLLAPIFAALVKIGHSLGDFFHNLTGSLRAFLARLLPDESIYTLPSSVMLFFAVSIPLVVVAVATVVYFQRGRTGQFQALYAQAVQASGYAQTQGDPQERLEAWQTVLSYLDQAETYQVTQETLDLRDQALYVLDSLELITRLDYQPAISNGLPGSQNITRMIATENDLFLLNETKGNVQRAIRTGKGYELDTTFQCDPNYPTGRTAPFIDITVSLNSGDRHATLLALDSNGDLVACVAGEAPRLIPLAAPPTSGGKPTAIHSERGNLYVLDPESNAVWTYWNGNYGDPPQLFFDNEIPPLKDVVDMAVNNDELYLLQGDGRITLCTFSQTGTSPTRCQDPAPYIDTRPGRENQVMLPGTPFTQITISQPPDPSLFLLQPDNQATYNYTLRLLNFLGQYRPQLDAQLVSIQPSETATAFALTPDAQLAFLAFGDNVYYASSR